MIPSWVRHGVVILCLCGVLGSACSSSDDGGGIGGTGVTPDDTAGASYGRITSFGSIEVNDIHYDIRDAALTSDGETIMETGLGLGDVVLVRGTINSDGTTGTAISVSANDEVEGPITSVADAADGLIDVLGQAVRADTTTATAFDGFDTLEELVVNNVVEVHGFVDLVTGVINATRIELKAPAVTAGVTRIEIKGTIADFNGTDQFSLGSLTVRLNNETEIEVDGGLANGIFVEVKGVLNATFDMLTAAKIDGEDESPLPSLNPGTEVKFEGIISDFVGVGDFTVNGVPVNGQNAEFEDGSASDLATGVKVEVAGVLNDAGILMADEIEIEKKSTVRIDANVVGTPTPTSLDVSVGAHTLTVHINASTELEDDTDAEDDTDDDTETFQLTNIMVGERVEILGFVDGATGDIIAVSLKREGFDDATDDVKLRGPVDMGLTANPLVVTLGVQVDTDTPGFTCEYDDTTITCDNFFTRLDADPAAIVEVVDEEADGVFDTVEVKEE